MNQQHKDFSQATAVVHELFGDYGLLIDEALGGDKRLKERIAQADAFSRGGLSILENALKNQGVVLVGKLADVLQSCRMDQAAWQEAQTDLQNIEVRGGSYRAKVQIEDSVFRRSFKTLKAAQVWRDRMVILKRDTTLG